MLGGPEETGRRLLPHVLAYQTAKSPKETFATIPLVLNDHRGPWYDFTFEDLTRAVDYTAWWIDGHLVDGEAGDIVAYLGVSDIRYFVVFLACMKTGRVTFLPSTRNSLSTHSHLIQVVGYKDLMYTTERQSSVEEIHKSHPNIRLWKTPSLEEMTKKVVKPYPFNTSFEVAEDMLGALMHSSGTTGMPKPVKFTNGYFACYDNLAHCTPTEDGRTYPFIGERRGRHLAPAIFFHMSGFLHLLEALLRNLKIIIVPERMMNERALAEILQAKNPSSATLISSIVESLYHAGSLPILVKLDFVITGGGPISRSVGDAVSKEVSLISGYGCTEAGIPPYVVPQSPEDWRYIQILPDWGFELEYYENDTFEGVIKRRSKTRDFNGVFHSHPHLDEYRTKDLFSKHPTKQELMAFERRIDDVIVLSNGEKFNPSDMELIIARHPKVKQAMIVGEGRFEPALILELHMDPNNADISGNFIIDEIWPHVIEANKTTYAHGRIVKSRIAIADPSVPFKLGAKHTIQRRHTIQDHAATIDGVYSKPIYSYTKVLRSQPSLSEVQEFVIEAVSDLLGTFDLTLSTNILDLGIDSLHMLQIIAFIRNTLQQQTGENVHVAATWLYGNPTVERIAEIVFSLISRKDFPLTHDSQVAEALKKIETLVKKYTETIPNGPRAIPPSESTHTVVLTGSTGSLGSYVLNLLLKLPTVKRIYCLNRSANAESKQSKSFEKKGLEFTNATRVCKFYQARYGEFQLGLPTSVYAELTSSVDAIIHNAWEVNFNLGLDHFESVHIQGVRRLVDLSLESRRFAHIHFISSRGSVGAWAPEKGPVPEQIIEDSSIADGLGYGTSKHISERILARAATQAGVPVTIHRVGQVAGPTTEHGEWNRNEWLPSLVITSKEIGQIPESVSFAPMDWIPVDTMAHIIIDLIRARKSSESDVRCQIFHLSNAHETNWSSLIPTIQNRFTARSVPFSTWLKSLGSTELSSEEIARKPALKLLDFFTSSAGVQGRLQQLSTDAAAAASKTFRELGPTSPELFNSWLSQWDL